MGGKRSVLVICLEEAITRGFLTGSACPYFGQDPRSHGTKYFPV